MNQTELRKTWNWNGLSCRTKSQKHYAQVQRLYHYFNDNCATIQRLLSLSEFH
uniref:Uncharacterized protein n=1 Tax=Anguilla anguilla TaxID=7936 RepID=A0A0E9THG4_ANGAN